MSLPNATISKCTVDFESEICTHGCHLEWRIKNFEYPRFATSQDITPPGCGHSWQLRITSLKGQLMDVSLQLSGEKQDVVRFYVMAHISLQNSDGHVFNNKTFEEKGLTLPQSFQIGRPSAQRALLIPGAADGDHFRLGEDGVLVIKAVILSKGCCIKKRVTKHIV